MHYPPPKMTPGDYAIGGKLSVDDAGFSLNLNVKLGGIPPISIPPPADTTVIRPSGGDDRQALYDAWNALPSDHTLMVSGMLLISDSMQLSGSAKHMVADPAKQSGFRSTCSSGAMSGAYCAMVHLVNADHCILRGLEFDGGNHLACPIYMENGTDNTVENCYIHDVGFAQNDPRPMAALFSDNQTRLRVVNNRIERTGGYADNDGCRGIWLRGQVDAVVEGNQISDTGHTCCAVECSTATIRNNRALRSLLNGTLYKLVYRAGQPAGTVTFNNNYAEQSNNAGIMLEDGTFGLVDMYGNTWKNCGGEGTSFGSIYTNGQPATNVKFHNNTLDGCKSTGALRYANNCLFQDNQIVNGPATLTLEESDTNIRLVNSGGVSVGGNCSNVWVDGTQVC
jgi:hypothetical protein